MEAIIKKTEDQMDIFQKRLKDKHNERMNRTFKILEKYSPNLAGEVFLHHKSTDKYTKSATIIQSL